MTKLQTHVEASLLYTSQGNPLRSVDVVALRSMIERLGATVEDVCRMRDEFVLLVCDRVQILIAFCPLPFPADHFSGVCRPDADEDAQAQVLDLLNSHVESITVLVTAREDVAPWPADALSQDARRRFCWETLDCLMAMTSPSLIFWLEDDQLLTLPEAEYAIARMASPTIDDKAVHPRRPAQCSAKPTHRPQAIRLPRPQLPDHETCAVGPLRPRVIPQRPDPSGRPPTHDIFLRDPELTPRAAAWFNPPPPKPCDDPDRAATSALRAFLAHQEGEDVHALSDTAAGRASIYALSATIMVFALPVGAGVLTYNALGKGSMRTTAHMMALTGIGTVLMALGLPNPAMALAGFL